MPIALKSARSATRQDFFYVGLILKGAFAALVLSCATALYAPSASAQPASETAARLTITEFIASCSPLVTDPATAVAAAAARPDLSHADTADGRFLNLGYPVGTTSGTPWDVYVTYEIAAIGPNTWIVTCNAISYYRDDVVDDVAAAFETVIDSMPGLQRVGGPLRTISTGRDGIDPGELPESQSLYVVTGWNTADPLLHMWAEMGDFGYDLWIQHSVRTGG